mmetsp:Transcript_9839/g.25884  ORF Transcript_9839/g.25884 Transcript_9839/m.25884 type:complete len:244 (-) Transcript_9839:39-770(-)
MHEPEAMQGLEAPEDLPGEAFHVGLCHGEALILNHLLQVAVHEVHDQMQRAAVGEHVYTAHDIGVLDRLHQLDFPQGDESNATYGAIGLGCLGLFHRDDPASADVAGLVDLAVRAFPDVRLYALVLGGRRLRLREVFAEPLLPHTHLHRGSRRRDGAQRCRRGPRRPRRGSPSLRRMGGRGDAGLLLLLLVLQGHCRSPGCWRHRERIRQRRRGRSGAHSCARTPRPGQAHARSCASPHAGGR